MLAAGTGRAGTNVAFELEQSLTSQGRGRMDAFADSRMRLASVGYT